MTVATSVNRAQFLGSGSAGPFTFNMRFFENSEISVIHVDAADIETVLTEGIGYTLTGAGSLTGGAVTLATALATGEALTVVRTLDLLQLTSLRNQGAFFPEIHEDAFDSFVMMMQQISEQAGRAIKMPFAASGNFTIPSGSRDGKVLGFDSQGAPAIVNIGGEGVTMHLLGDETAYGVKSFEDAIVRNGASVDSRGYASLADADAVAAAAGKQLIISTVHSIPTVLTLNSDVVVLPGGMLDVAGDLNINGHFEAGAYTIFSDTANVVFSDNSSVSARPEWWGVDGVNDEVEIDKALTAAKAVSLTKKYTVGNAASTGALISMQPKRKLVGTGAAEIYLPAIPNNIGNTYAIEVPLGSDDCLIAGIAFTGPGSTAEGVNYPSAIRVHKANGCTIYKNSFDGVCWGVFISADNSVDNNPYGTKVVMNNFHNMTGPVSVKGGYGILCTFNEGTVIAGNTFDGTSRHCIYLSAATKKANVYGNVCKGSEFSPITIYAGDVAGNDIYGCIVHGNQFYCLGTYLANSHGIPMTGAVYNNVISHNLVVGARDLGIMMQAASATRYPHHNIFLGNIVTGGMSWGLSCIDSMSCIFADNIIMNNCAINGVYEVFFGKTNVVGAGKHRISGGQITSNAASIRYNLYIGAACDYCEITPPTFGGSGAGWAPMEDASGTARVAMSNPGAQTVAYAANVSVDPTLGEIVNITLTGPITVGINSDKRFKGQRLTFRFLQDGTGGRAVTFSAAFKANWSDAGNTANKTNTVSFVCMDGVSFVQTGAATGYHIA